MASQGGRCALSVAAKPLFRPDVLRAHVAAFDLPPRVDAFRPRLKHWADLLGSTKAGGFKEQELLPDFLTDFFCTLLGYTLPGRRRPALHDLPRAPRGGRRQVRRRRAGHVR
jgi:hypothetical protein